MCLLVSSLTDTMTYYVFFFCFFLEQLDKKTAEQEKAAARTQELEEQIETVSAEESNITSC